MIVRFAILLHSQSPAAYRALREMSPEAPSWIDTLRLQSCHSSKIRIPARSLHGTEKAASGSHRPPRLSSQPRLTTQLRGSTLVSFRPYIPTPSRLLRLHINIQHQHTTPHLHTVPFKHFMIPHKKIDPASLGHREGGTTFCFRLPLLEVVKHFSRYPHLKNFTTLYILWWNCAVWFLPCESSLMSLAIGRSCKTPFTVPIPKRLHRTLYSLVHLCCVWFLPCEYSLMSHGASIQQHHLRFPTRLRPSLFWTLHQGQDRQDKGIHWLNLRPSSQDQLPEAPTGPGQHGKHSIQGVIHLQTQGPDGWVTGTPTSCLL